MNNGNGSLGINDLSIGFDPRGMQAYVEKLNLEAITKTKAIIRDLDPVYDNLQTGWQGTAEVNYEKKLHTASEDLCQKLDILQKTLYAQFSEIAENYIRQDAKMVEE